MLAPVPDSNIALTDPHCRRNSPARGSKAPSPPRPPMPMKAPNVLPTPSRPSCQPLQPVLPHVPHHQQPGLPVGARPRDPPAHQLHPKELQVHRVSFQPLPPDPGWEHESLWGGWGARGKGRGTCLLPKPSLLAGAVLTVSTRRTPSRTVCRGTGRTLAPSTVNTCSCTRIWSSGSKRRTR